MAEMRQPYSPGRRRGRVAWVLRLFLPWVLLIQRMEEGWQGLITIMLDVPESGRFRSLVSSEMETAWKCLFSTPRLYASRVFLCHWVPTG